MKTKKILALLVALAMVLAIVPGLGMVASAEDGDTVEVGGLTYKVLGDNLVPDGGFEDADGNFSWGTWESPNGSNGYFKDNCSDWFYKVNRDTNEAQLYPADGMAAEDYALGSRWNDGTLGLCSLANYIPVTPGTYYVAFDYKHKTGSGTDFIQTSFKNNRDDYNSPSDVFKPAAATTEWQKAETIMEVTEDGYVYFHFRWLGADGNPGNGPYWYFDNFVVEAVELVPVSTESTVKAALDALEVPAMAKAEIELPVEAVDAFETELTVTWASSNEDVIAADGTVTPTDKVETVALTPSAEFEGKTVTGAAKNVTVFPAPLAGGTYNGAEVGKTNLIAGFENGWSDGTGAALAESAGLTVETEGDVTYVKTNGSGGVASANSLHGEFDVLKPGVTYLMAVTAKDFTPSWVGTDFGDGEKVQQNNNSIFENVAVNEWRRVTATFTAASTTLKIASRWNNSSFESFELYELTAPDSEDIAAALDALEVDTMSKGAAIELPATVAVGSEDEEEEDDAPEGAAVDTLDITWYTSDAAVVAADGTVTQADEVKTATLTPAVNVNGVNVTGKARTIVVFPVDLSGEYSTGTAAYTIGDKVFSSDFENDDIWVDGKGTKLGEGNGLSVKTNNDVTYVETHYDNSKTNDNGANSIRALKGTIGGLTEGTTYLLTVTATNLDPGYVGVNPGNGELVESAGNSIFSSGKLDGWARVAGVFTAESEEVIVHSRWNNSLYESIEIYELTLIPEDLAELDPIADVTVIKGNDVVLPTVVTGKGDHGSAMTVKVEWNLDNVKDEVGTYTATATAEDTDVTATVNVEVIDVTDDSLADQEIVNVNKQGGSDEAVHKLAEAVQGAASFEFDVVYSGANLKTDDLIALGSTKVGARPSFGSEAFAMQGRENNTMKVGFRTSNGGWSDSFVAEKDKTYRVFTTLDIDAGTYDVTVTEHDGPVVLTLTGLGYRAAATKDIDALVVIHNNNNTEATTTVTNFRVSWPDSGNYKNVAVQYETEDGTVIGTTAPAQYKVGDTIEVEASKAYYDGKIYDLAAVNEEVTADTEDVVKAEATVAEEYAATEVAYYDGGASTDLYGYVAVAGASKIPAVDEFGLPMVSGSTNNYGSERRMSLTIAVPTLEDGESAILNIAAGAVRDNNGSTTGGAVRIRADYNGTYGYSTAWTDTASGDGGTKLPADLIYGTADITNIVKAANAAGEETITLLLQVYQGGVGLVNEAQSAFGGVAQGYASYISVIDTPVVDVPAIDVQLGFANNAFTIDFLFGGALADGDYSISIVSADGQVFGTAVDGDISFNPGNTNAKIKAALITTVDGVTVKGAETDVIAIYSLVVDAIVNFADEAITEDQLAAAVKVLNAGGIYIKNDNGTKSLTKEAQKIMKLEGETITLNAEVADLGLKFVEGVKAQVGEDIVDVEVTDTTITIAGLDAMEAAVIYLEDVEFVLETVESVADEAVSGELDFVEEV